MKTKRCLLIVSAIIATRAMAWQAWDDRELFSTPDGRVQFVELYSPTNGQGLLGTRELRSVSADGLRTNSFIFNHDVGNSSSNKTVLIATAGFQYLPGGVLPDFTNLPFGFLFTGGGSVALVGGTATQSYGPGVLPLDGQNSLATPDLSTNRASPKNFAGAAGAVLVAVPGGARVYYEGLYHNRPNLAPEAEALPHPAYASNTFLETRYGETNITLHFLSAAPAGDGDVSARVRLFPVGPNGNAEVLADAYWLTNIQLTATNAFHGAPFAETLGGSNSLKNAGLETNGLWWIPFNQAEFVTNPVRSGAFSTRLGDSNEFHGVYQDIRATTSRVYRWGAWALKDPGYTASNTWLKIEWKDASLATLGFADLDINGQLTTNWQQFSMLATSPVGTAWVRALLLNRGSGTGSNFVHWDDAAYAYVPPVTETNVVSLWRATWTPPRTFTGTVYYAPQILVSSNGQVKDFQYLLRTIGANVGSTNFGINEFFWRTDPQVLGKDYFNLDYSTAWTNAAPFNFDGIYFNSTNTGKPWTEFVPGMPGRKFFDWNVDGSGLSYVHMLAPPGAILAVTTRFDFVAGGGEFFLPGQVVTSVVIDVGAPFHGAPASGAVTLDVWRTSFYPPPGWSNIVYFGMAIATPHDGATWLVTDVNGAGAGFGVTNSFVPPQYFFTGGPVNRDWSYTPTAMVARAGVQRDYLYHNNTNLSPQVENIPSHAPYQFLEVNYATTTTTFYVMTDHPVNVAPGESVTVQLRIDYNHPETGFSPVFYNMVFDQSLSISSFHGLPVSGTHTVDLWRLDWPQPRYANNLPVTNPLTVYYAPFIKTTMGAQQFQTDYAYLLGIPAGGSPNGFPIQPQITGPDFNNYDYAYPHKYATDGDGDGMLDEWELQHFGTLTNEADGDVDADGWRNLYEYIADTIPTNDASFFPAITNATMTGAVLRVVINPTSPNRVYDIYEKTNLLEGAGWTPGGLPHAGTGSNLILFVTNGPPIRHYRTGVKLP